MPSYSYSLLIFISRQIIAEQEIIHYILKDSSSSTHTHLDPSVTVVFTKQVYKGKDGYPDRYNSNNPKS